VIAVSARGRPLGASILAAPAAASLRSVLPTTEITEGLVRWVAAHPDWKPGADPGSVSDWPRLVGSVLYELPNVAALIDPLIPREHADEFLAWLDARVRGRAVTILTTIRFHRRDREQLAARYSATTTRAWNWIPPGVTPWRLHGAREIAFWLPRVATLVPGDSLIGTENGLRLCPESWLADARVSRKGLAERMRPLLGLVIERVLVSHGDPVLRDGHSALAHAIEEAGG
jgi:hypothetical protein